MKINSAQFLGGALVALSTAALALVAQRAEAATPIADIQAIAKETVQGTGPSTTHSIPSPKKSPSRSPTPRATIRCSRAH